MKRVSFKTAKALKDAGYPQYGRCEEFYDASGKVVDKMCDMHKLVYPCPTYLEVWLWLWREKKFSIDVDCYNCDKWTTDVNGIEFNDPEEAIIAAIEYLTENDIIK